MCFPESFKERGGCGQVYAHSKLEVGFGAGGHNAMEDVNCVQRE